MIAILYICTGRYLRFWEGFYTSMEAHFLPDTEKHYYVFTDSETLQVGEDSPRVHRIHQEDLGWPGNTLYRFRMFLRVEEDLKNYDYIFYFNANYVCLKDISEEEFLPEKDQLLVTLHPGFFQLRPAWFAYDRNHRSTAYVSYYSLRSKHYFCGGLNGGGAQRYLKLIHDLDRQISEDDRRGITAIFHDESHLNRYMLTQENYKILSPSFAYPQGKELPFEPKLLLLEKRKIWSLEDRQPDMTGQKRFTKLRRYLSYPIDYIKRR